MAQTHFVRKIPTLALALNFLVPGLGHVYLRQYKRAITFFLTVNALFALGLFFAGPTVYILSGIGNLPYGASKFYLLFLLPIPELLNLSGTIVGAFLYIPQVLAQSSEVYEFANLGLVLTAFSGLANLFIMCDAWTLATHTPHEWKQEPAFAAALSWLMPGAGHFYLGQKARAAVFFVSINALYLMGFLLSAGLIVNRERLFYYWTGESLQGLVHLVMTVVAGGNRMTETIPYYDLGILFATVAGLLNVLSIISAHASAEAKIERKEL